MSEQDKEVRGKRRIAEGIRIIVDEAKATGEDVIHRSGVDSLGENLKQALQGALSSRENVVMVRLNKESLARLDELVDASLVGSRSEAAAFLIAQGVKANGDLFGRISEKIGQIREMREELRQLLNEPSSEGGEE